MKPIDKFKYTLSSAYKSVFRKKTIIGKMGYLNEEMYVIANDINYRDFDIKDILMCKTESKECRQGINMFLGKKYKESYSLFNDVNPIEHAEVLFCQALCLILGKGVKKNIQQAIYKLTDGKEKSSCCKLLLSTFYIQGDKDIETNHENAYNLITQAINSENSDINKDNIKSTYYYFCGDYNYQKQNLELAREYFEKAAGHGYGMAYYMLGKMYWDKEEKERATYYFDKAKQNRVSVPHKYYKDDRDDIPEQEINIQSKVEKTLNTMRDVGEMSDIYIDKLDPNIIKGKLEENKTKGKISKIDSKTSILKAERNKKREETKILKQNMSYNKWKKRKEKQETKK